MEKFLKMFKLYHSPTAWCLTLLLALCGHELIVPAWANPLAVNWLASQAQPAGDYRTATDLATSFPATMETLRAWSQLGETESSQPTLKPALEFLQGETFTSTEYLSRRLILQALTAQPTDSRAQELLTRLNDNGGFGDLPGYHQTMIDTAWALDALAYTQTPNTSLPTLLPAIAFLLQQQSPTAGGWGELGTETSVPLTALVMHALWQYRHSLNNYPTLNVTPALDQAQAYLLAQRQNNGLWQETFTSALALLALLPRISHREELSASVEALRTAQLANGSWDNDVYTTALVLQALSLADAPQPNPDFGQLTGTVIDGQRNLPISGILVELTNTGAQTVTNSQGQFNFSNLLAGHYTVTIGTLSADTQVQRGQTVNFGNLRLFQATNATLLQGTVRDAHTGQPVAGVAITFTGLETPVVTDSQGTYLLNTTITGERLVQATKPGYLTASLTVTLVTGTSLVFSPALSPDTITLQGQVTRRIDGVGLGGVSLLVNGTQVAQTTADGSYSVAGLPSGMVTLRAELTGYETVTSTATVPTQTTLTFSPRLSPAGTNPADGGHAGVTGQVIDQATGLPLSEVQVTNGSLTTQTDATGHFSFIELEATGVVIQFQVTGYHNQLRSVDLLAFTLLDLGEVKLTPLNYQEHSGVKGMILDARTDQPLAGVTLTAAFGEPPYPTVTTTAAGTFEFTRLPGLTGKLLVTKASYVPVTLEVFAGANETLDLGTVRLPPAELVALLPDLVIAAVNPTALTTDPQTLIVSGDLLVQLQNRGTATTSAGNLTLLAFYDANHNDAYEVDSDVLLGETTLNQPVNIGESVAVNLAVAGQLPFRDAPLKVWVDSGQTVVESQEDNNVGTTAALCTLLQNMTTPILTGAAGIGVPDSQFTCWAPNNPRALTPVAMAAPYYWVRPSSGAWVGPPGGSSGGQSGKYLYTYTFTLSNLNNVSLSGTWASDNGMVGTLNGQTLINAPGADAYTFTALHPFSTPSNFFQLGVNELRLAVDNGYGPTGLYLNANLTTQSLTPVTDLTASRLQIVDHGFGIPLSLQVRIGNGGVNTSPALLPVTFYAGDPAAGGSWLGTVKLEPLAPSTYQDVQLEGVQLQDLQQELYAVVDANHLVAECNEANNSTHTSIRAGTTTFLGSLNVTTDAADYGPNSAVAINYLLHNLGALPADFQVQLRLETANGDLVTALTSPTLTTLSGDQTQPGEVHWNTGTSLAGTYRVHGLLFSAAGKLLTETDSPFTITAHQAALLSVHPTVNQSLYHTTDTVQINNVIQNLTVNTLVSGARLRVTISDSTQKLVFTQTLPVADLGPGNLHEIATAYAFQATKEGLYTLQSDVLTTTGEVLASQTTQYRVQENLKLSLVGQVAVQLPSLFQGEAQVCTDTLTNQGTLPLTNQALRQLLIAIESHQEVSVTDVVVTLPAGASQVLTQPVTTRGLAVGNYACVLQASLNGQWESLGYARFQLTAPPIVIDHHFTLGTRGRFLILLDKGQPANHDPHGSQSAPSQTVQRTWLDTLLQAQGWSYTVVTDETSFTHELRSGGYSVYVLLSEQEQLPEQVQQELREAVYRGEGLVVAGSHDQRQQLGEVLGIKYQGKLPQATGLQLNTSSLGVTGTATFGFAEPVLRTQLQGATLVGHFLSTNQPAVSLYSYGLGKSVYVGFDLLVQATLAGNNSLLAKLLTTAMTVVQPATFSPRAGSVIPLQLTLTNQGMATSGQVSLPLPADTQVIDTGSAQLLPNQTLLWPMTLEKDAVVALTFWLRLPWQTVPTLTLTGTLVIAGQNYDTVSLTVPMQPAVNQTELFNQLQALALQDKSYRQAFNRWQDAQLALQQGEEARALTSLIQATTAWPSPVHSPSVRVELDGLIREVAAVVALTTPP